MWNKPALGGPGILIGVMLLGLCTTSDPLLAGQTETSQAQVLAEIAVDLVTCSSHPCLGDSERDVRKELHNRIVSDGTFYYSDLATAFPPARKFLSGLAEWDFDPELDLVSLKISDFRAEPSLFLPELERALPGCQMERDDDLETDSADEEDESEGDSTREWSCTAQGYNSEDILIEVYLVPGLAIVEMGF